CHGEINIAGILKDRDQLFAEAVARYKMGESWWEMPEGTEEQQRARYKEDVWTSGVIEFIEGWVDSELRIIQILQAEPFHFALERVDNRMQGRVGNILRYLGWKTKHTKKGNVWVPGPKARVLPGTSPKFAVKPTTNFEDIGKDDF